MVKQMRCESNELRKRKYMVCAAKCTKKHVMMTIGRGEIHARIGFVEYFEGFDQNIPKSREYRTSYVGVMNALTTAL